MGLQNIDMAEPATRRRHGLGRRVLLIDPFRVVAEHKKVKESGRTAW